MNTELIADEEKIETEVAQDEATSEVFEEETHYKQMSPIKLVLRRFFPFSLIYCWISNDSIIVFV